MKVLPFIAENAAEALARIHSELGPDAVVLSVRPLPRTGLARLWRKGPGVEVLACVAEPGDEPATMPAVAAGISNPPGLSLLSEQQPPLSLFDGTFRPHVFIGPPGVGKSTLLCKWMTRSVLQDNRLVKIWRLDGTGPNTADFLNVYAEALGVPVVRFWNSQGQTSAAPASADLILVDLPGVQLNDPESFESFKNQLGLLPNPRIHLVLNAAYENSILLEQYGAFAAFAPEDISFCHLDEEKALGKLSDFLAGTNCSLRFLSSGQKVPGDFHVASQSARLAPRLAA